jgi:hypothetical protein
MREAQAPVRYIVGVIYGRVEESLVMYHLRGPARESIGGISGAPAVRGNLYYYWFYICFTVSCLSLSRWSRAHLDIKTGFCQRE